MNGNRPETKMNGENGPANIVAQEVEQMSGIDYDGFDD